MTGARYPDPRISRSRQERLVRSLLRLTALVLASAVAILALWYFFSRADHRPVSEVDGVKQVSGVVDGRLAVYDGTGWDARFWNGVNLGTTLPGHSPGELTPTKEDYLRWFGQMEEMNVDVVRVYTILPPHFYETLHEFNSTREDPLWLV